jgi:hypothetical protein
MLPHVTTRLSRGIFSATDGAHREVFRTQQMFYLRVKENVPIDE